VLLTQNGTEKLHKLYAKIKKEQTNTDPEFWYALTNWYFTDARVQVGSSTGDSMAMRTRLGAATQALMTKSRGFGKGPRTMPPNPEAIPLRTAPGERRDALEHRTEGKWMKGPKNGGKPIWSQGGCLYTEPGHFHARNLHYNPSATDPFGIARDATAITLDESNVTQTDIANAEQLANTIAHLTHTGITRIEEYLRLLGISDEGLKILARLAKEAQEKVTGKHWEEEEHLTQATKEDLQKIDTYDAIICLMLSFIPERYWNPGMGPGPENLQHPDRIEHILQVLYFAKPTKKGTLNVKGIWGDYHAQIEPWHEPPGSDQESDPEGITTSDEEDAIPRERVEPDTVDTHEMLTQSDEERLGLDHRDQDQIHGQYEEREPPPTDDRPRDEQTNLRSIQGMSHVTPSGTPHHEVADRRLHEAREAALSPQKKGEYVRPPNPQAVSSSTPYQPYQPQNYAHPSRNPERAMEGQQDQSDLYQEMEQRLNALLNKVTSLRDAERIQNTTIRTPPPHAVEGTETSHTQDDPFRTCPEQMPSNRLPNPDPTDRMTSGPQGDPERTIQAGNTGGRRTQNERGGEDIPRFIEYITRHQPDFWWDYMQEHGRKPDAPQARQSTASDNERRRQERKAAWVKQLQDYKEVDTTGSERYESEEPERRSSHTKNSGPGHKGDTPRPSDQGPVPQSKPPTTTRRTIRTWISNVPQAQPDTAQAVPRYGNAPPANTQATTTERTGNTVPPQLPRGATGFEQRHATTSTGRNAKVPSPRTPNNQGFPRTTSPVDDSEYETLRQATAVRQHKDAIRYTELQAQEEAS
jgi:hypothetical protein